ncbi:MAG: hypothetical protein PHU85_00575 [Phycisphaerae bacterium]|nr:hypothetical protein [Phycisphaerae bacterium]
MPEQPGQAGAAPAAPATAVATDSITIERNQLPEEYRSDYRAAFGDGKKYRGLVARLQQAGYTPDVLEQMVTGFVEPGDRPGGSYPQGQYAQQPSFQPDPRIDQLSQRLQEMQTALGQIPQQFQTTLEQQQLRAKTEYERQQSVQDRSKARDQAIDQYAAGLGIQPKMPDGKDNPMYGMIRQACIDRMWQTMLDQTPEGLNRDDEASLKHYLDTPTDDHIKAGIDGMGWFKDYDSRAAARAAQAQMDIPGAATGERPGGGAAKPKDLHEGTAEHVDLVMEGIDLSPTG